MSAAAAGPALPDRYESIAALGKGGGGEVWAVRDRHTGARLALKVLAEGASDPERAALVREAVALSGLEGLGLPRVVHFGRLPSSGRVFMLRELVDGRSLQELLEQGDVPQRMLEALRGAAEQLTVLHRSGLLHGDVKPANIIIEPSGRATLVDLGLAAPWRDSGVPPEGLTPRYAAPELFQSKPLTVRAEVFALGVALSEILDQGAAALGTRERRELAQVAARATLDSPGARFPSADEFASALGRAAGLPVSADLGRDAALWPVVGIDVPASQLLEAIRGLGPGDALRVSGPPGAGKTALIRRMAWSLGIEGRSLVWVDEAISGDADAVAQELDSVGELADVIVLVDDADAASAEVRRRLAESQARGARLVVVSSGGSDAPTRVFDVPPLDARAALELVRGAIPSLTERLAERVVEVSGARPGELRRLVRLIASEAVASERDIEQLIAGEAPGSGRDLPADPLARVLYFLDRGRFNDASAALEAASQGDPLKLAVARARLNLGLGEPKAALEALAAARTLAEARPRSPDAVAWRLYLARAHIGVGDYAQGLELTQSIVEAGGAPGAEALAYQGLAQSFSGEHEAARQTLEHATRAARQVGSPRVEAVALASLGLALQRNDRLDAARDAYQRGLAAAERASDAGMLAMLQLSLAGLLKVEGELAGAVEHFEAAVDMGRRSGRRSTVRQALLNLANTDLYLGRLSRARAGIEALERQRGELGPLMRAQLCGLDAELAARSGDAEAAARGFEQCAAAYDLLGHHLDAAEARLEGVLVAARAERSDAAGLKVALERARQELHGAPAHRPLLLLAGARLAALSGDEKRARADLEEVLEAARAAGQREWLWRALEARAELEETMGQLLRARRDREEALLMLEEIGAQLPRDLREVYWNDPRRRQLRDRVRQTLGDISTEHVPRWPAKRGSAASSHTGKFGGKTISAHTSTPLEQRLARILEVNSELAGEHDLERLTARIVDHAVALLRAERGFVLLADANGKLTVHASRSRGTDDPHAEFSRSIAEDVIRRGEPLVTLSARDDARMASYASVHELMLQAVACVPITSPGGTAIGALYVETRLRSGRHFESETPTLQALADQAAIAIETARLLGENRARADELAQANEDLKAAQERLRELLGGRTQQLKHARKRLRAARDTLYGHFGYQGLVGTSEAMRRVYALIDRVKDTDVPILITGESGTGKEVVARAIHAASERGAQKFLGVNCGAIPEHLLESELFGHVRGAFTGADRERKGLFREAERGSVLLDEIGEMPQKMQAGMLRVLEERRVRPVGGSSEDPVDVRIIFATNRDLEAMVEAGTFREDLYYRIHVVELRLPPLRERIEDVPQLVDHFLGLFAARHKRERKLVTRDAMRRLSAYGWPGNVRQLEHVLLNAWVLGDQPELDAEDFDLPDGLGFAPPAPRVRVPSERVAAAPREGSLSQHRAQERDRILKALQACNWNRVKAAELSGIPRRTFYRRLREYGIQ